MWISGCSGELAADAEALECERGGSAGRHTLNERLTQMEPCAQAAHTASLTEIPPGLQLDGMWVSAQQSEASIKPDKHKKCRGKKKVILVALGC